MSDPCVHILTQTVEVQQLLTPLVQAQQLLTAIEQGPPGPAGDRTGTLLIDNRLSELATPAAREQAQANLGLGVVDPLAYYILAKA